MTHAARLPAGYVRSGAATLLALLLAGCAPTLAPAVSSNAPSASAATRTPASRPRLLFDDEFDADALDRSTWYTCYFWQKNPNRCAPGSVAFDANAVTEGGGSVQLVATMIAAAPHAKYATGMIQTGGSPTTPASFAFLYGYAEARMKFPRGAGMWPAFWLIPKSGAWPPEIDVIEGQGVAPTYDFATIHYVGASGNPAQNSSAIDTHVPLWSGYHTYAVDWEPQAVTWYFDGKPVKRFSQRRYIPNVPMYVVFDLGIGGWLPGSNDLKAGEFPATFAIDYVRVWSAKP